MRTILKSLVLAGSMLSMVVATGCSTAPSTQEGKAAKELEADTTLKTARTNDPSLGKLLDSAKAYAVFPTVGKGAIGIGGAYGKGVFYSGGAVVGYCDLTQASIGLALGGQAYSEIIAFETDDAAKRFQSGNFSFAAQAKEVAVDVGHATDHPDCDPRKFGETKLGGGPIICRGPNIGGPGVNAMTVKCNEAKR